MSQSITVELSESVYRHLSELAAETKQPMESLIRQSVEGNLPPLPTATGDQRNQLLAMQSLTVEELHAVAHQQLPQAVQKRHTVLLEKNSRGSLNLDEGEELEKLRIEADTLMLRKAYAWALLRWRGVPIPALNELPNA